MADHRMPVWFGAAQDLRPGDALLHQGEAPPLWRGPAVSLPNAAAHGAFCACGTAACASGRDPWAEVLNRMILEQLRRHSPDFNRVVAVLTPEAEARLKLLLVEDRVVAVRYRQG